MVDVSVAPTRRLHSRMPRPTQQSVLQVVSSSVLSPRPPAANTPIQVSVSAPKTLHTSRSVASNPSSSSTSVPFLKPTIPNSSSSSFLICQPKKLSSPSASPTSRPAFSSSSRTPVKKTPLREQPASSHNHIVTKPTPATATHVNFDEKPQLLFQSRASFEAPSTAAMARIKRLVAATTMTTSNAPKMATRTITAVNGACVNNSTAASVREESGLVASSSIAELCGTYRAAPSAKSTADFIKTVDIFSGLSDLQLTELCSSLAQMTMEEGELVVRQGDLASEFYIVKSGVCVCEQNDTNGQVRVVARLYERDYFGQNGLLGACRRTASVRVEAKATLLVLKRSQFESLPIALKDILRISQERQILNNIPLLGVLTCEEKNQVAASLESRTYTEGTQILKQGESSSEFYIIRSGQVKCTQRTDNGGEQCLCILGPGSYFGEKALVENDVRTATVTAISPVVCGVFSMNRDSFLSLLAPPVGYFDRAKTNHGTRPKTQQRLSLRRGSCLM